MSTKMTCPTCAADDDLNPLQQRYMCTAHVNHGPFSKGDAFTALVIDGDLHKPTTDLIAEINQSDGTRGQVDLTVYRSAEVEHYTLATGNIYRLRPRSNLDHYGLVLELVADTTMAFVGEVTNKGVTKLYRLVAHDGALMLTELVRPSEIHPPETVSVSFDPKLLATGRMLVESLVDDFDPETYTDRRKARLVAAAEQMAPERELAPVEGSAAQAATDLMEQLRRSVEAAKAA